MKQYLQNLKQRSPHEQRGHALRLSGIITVAVFFVWLTATGVRLSFVAQGPTKDASGASQSTLASDASQNESLIANVISAAPGAGGASANNSSNNLVVATTTQ